MSLDILMTFNEKKWNKTKINTYFTIKNLKIETCCKTQVEKSAMIKKVQERKVKGI